MILSQITIGPPAFVMGKKERLILHLLTHGLSRKEAEDYCGRNFEITDFFADNPTAGYTFVKGNMIFYGKKTGKKSNTPS